MDVQFSRPQAVRQFVRLAGDIGSAAGQPEGHDVAIPVFLIVHCEDQDEIDRYWNALSAVPEAEQCGWLKNRFGVSWQIVPAAMDSLTRLTQAG
ncbi:MAG TPA: VOC family protein [Rhodocyclaceae bacterium]|nr:VOC family protein [Rhodocyclaceae bacterium]